ncbi:MAG: glycosyltransferase [Acidobacteria bacterium]|nr:MAG: glycosyltransferase [Acidobacteriota bacterium]PYY03007.1 MAG: glycosyltransferase [Acidobacteriota bacterium]PYY23322.1 MAG: glycosyltransferase [Acidobacteriota bacterium]
MIDRGKHNLLGILVDAVDYEAAVDRVLDAAREHRGAAISALAVHGIMTGVLDPIHRYRLNRFDLIVPDGQPVRWALNLMYGARLEDRVYGPELTLRVCERAAGEQAPVFFYGSTLPVLERMQRNLLKRFPKLKVAGMEASKFRRLTQQEATELSKRIRESGATIVFAGLGCPRQETWAYEFRDLVSMPILAVGAAFPFIAGELRQAPPRLQRMGMEWFFRLCMEPKRLCRRYALLNPAYIALVTMQYARITTFDTAGIMPKSSMLFG